MADMIICGILSHWALTQCSILHMAHGMKSTCHGMPSHPLIFTASGTESQKSFVTLSMTHSKLVPETRTDPVFPLPGPGVFTRVLFTCNQQYLVKHEPENKTARDGQELSL